MEQPYDPQAAAGTGGPSGQPGPGDTASSGTAEGMGSTVRGPAFLPWSSAEPTQPDPPAAPVSAVDLFPTRSRWPAIISVLAIVVVAAVVVGASLSARYADTHIARPAATVGQPPPPVSSRDDRIEFTTARGTGELILTSRTWTNAGSQPPTSGSYLRVQIELVCHTGQVDYGPYNFEAFDQTGGLYELSAEGASEPLLAVGRLHAGETVRGELAFDVPRGEITLLMNDDANNNVTALKVRE
jgi:hypothetical protein